MTNYIPGSGYDKGYSARMSGGELPLQASSGVADPYWQEYAIGWRDAEERIIKEARQRNGSINESSKGKSFIQD